MSVSLVWAEARGRVIGDGGTIPWHVPEDLAHFKQLTSSGTVVMGRRTWESLPARFRPLPDRVNIVVTRDSAFSADGARVAHSLADALDAAGDSDPAQTAASTWVIGGGEIYAQAMPRASRLEVTEIDIEVEGDTTAPVIDPVGWRVAEASEWLESRTGIRYRFVSYAPTGV